VTAARLSPAPVLRLLAAPRAAVVLLGGAAWTLGGAWMGAMTRFTAMKPAQAVEGEVFGALIAALLLFGVPALAGLVAGEAAQELFRRPMTSRLPGIVRRVADAARALGLLACLACAAAVLALWGPTDLRLTEIGVARPGVIATLAVALAGFAAGSWVLARVGYGWSWILRLAGFLALAHAAQPLLVAATRWPVLGIAVAAAAVVAAELRYRPRMAAAMARGSVPTVFGPVRDWARREDWDERVASPAADRLLPNGRLGGDLRGWMRALAFEQRTDRNGTRTWQAIGWLAAISVAVGMVGPVIGWVLERGGETPGLAAFLAIELLGGSDAALPGLFIVLALASGLQAFLAGTPFTPAFPYPLSRRMRARVAFRAAVTVGFGHHAAVLALGLGLGGLLAYLGGVAWPAGLPAIASFALIHLLVFPVYAAVGLRLRAAARLGRVWSAGIGYGVPLVVALGAAAGLRSEWEPFVEAHARIAGVAYACAVAAGFALLRGFVRRHYAVADLV
jgi:hypothetical protein